MTVTGPGGVFGVGVSTDAVTVTGCGRLGDRVLFGGKTVTTVGGLAEKERLLAERGGGNGVTKTVLGAGSVSTMADGPDGRGGVTVMMLGPAGVAGGKGGSTVRLAGTAVEVLAGPGGIDELVKTTVLGGGGTVLLEFNGGDGAGGDGAGVVLGPADDDDEVVVVVTLDRHTPGATTPLTHLHEDEHGLPGAPLSGPLSHSSPYAGSVRLLPQPSGVAPRAMM